MQKALEWAEEQLADRPATLTPEQERSLSLWGKVEPSEKKRAA